MNTQHTIENGNDGAHAPPLHTVAELKQLREEAEREILAILNSLANLTGLDVRGVEVHAHVTAMHGGAPQCRPFGVRIDLCI